MVVSARPRRPYRWRHNWIPRNAAAALIKAKGNRKLADRYMARSGGGSTVTKQPPRRDEGPYFRKTGPELRELAKNGDRDAQAELARRLARKEASGKVGGKRPGVPFRPNTDRPTEPPRPKDVELPKRTTPPRAHRTTPQGPPKSTLDAAQRVAQARERHGYGSPEHIEALNSQNELWTADTPYVIQSKKLTNVVAGSTTVMDVQMRPDGTRIGSVIHRGGDSEGTYEAKLDGKPIGTFASRLEAHRTLDREHERQKRARELEDARRADMRRNTGKKAAGGAWQTHELPDDGSFSARIARQKVKQAFKSGNATVLIETRMSEAQTKAFLTDVRAVIDRAGLADRDITFRVPTGDGQFRTRKNGGVTGAYVQRGIPTVFVNPKIAGGDPHLLEAFGNGGHTGHFMPAAKDVPARQYTLTHELGHVLDGFQQDTFRQGTFTPSGFQLPDNPGETAATLSREHRHEFSKYGRSNLQEGYAEAFAQWVLGGPGSSRIADAYARRFGWPTPRPA